MQISVFAGGFNLCKHSNELIRPSRAENACRNIYVEMEEISLQRQFEAISIFPATPTNTLFPGT